MRCSICGKETSAGEGYETSIGFVCISCYNARDFQICTECGRRFPRDEMVEWNGLFYCRSDYFRARERYERIIEEEKRKKQEEERRKQPPLIKPSSGLGIPIHKRKKKINEDEMKSLIGELHKTKFKKMKKEETEGKKEAESKEESKEKSKEEDFHSLLAQISSFADVTASQISEISDVSISKSSKEKRKDALTDALNELNSIIRGRRAQDKKD